MKIINSTLIFVILFGSALIISAQVDVQNPPNDFTPPERPKNQISLLRELGLDQEQIQKIRQINQEMRPQRQEAQRKLRMAKQTLDASIYADNIDNSTIEQNLRNMVEAQTQLIKLKAQQELAVRNVLTPEQLVKFREIRREFQQRQGKRDMRRKRMMRRRGMRPNPNQ